jgi:guanosine-3',5'-bis(diphosphate) 3'-pyrophosphohydrolase
VCVLIPEVSGVTIEIQIMTYDMYVYNNYGGASHMAYKSQGKRNAKISHDFEWVKQVHNAFRSRPIITNVFAERLFVFTPKERIVELPLGSTPVDFAFKVHTDMARRLIGAKVNGLTVELSTQLKNGDIVEILESPNKFTVSTLKKEWLKFVKTDTARREIEKYTKRW